MTRPVIVWFRRDLRLADNPAFAGAVATGAPVLPLYVLDDETPGRFRDGGAARWWLHGSLAALAASLRDHGLSLVLRRGVAHKVVPQVAREAGAAAVVWNRRYEPWAGVSDARIAAALGVGGVEVRSYNASLLAEPWEIEFDTGPPAFDMFNRFSRALSKRALSERPRCVAALTGPVAAAPPLVSDRLDGWRLRPTVSGRASDFGEVWTPGEAAAQARLAAFVSGGLAHYEAGRDRLDGEGAARLSPHIAWGELGPRQVAAALVAHIEEGGRDTRPWLVWAPLEELVWREFAWHLLHRFPSMAAECADRAFDAMAWRDDPAGLAAWQCGRTGYPAVDAGMRELRRTGWLSKRARMVVASFLASHLLIDWRTGADWFLDTLVDADLAGNAAYWQWLVGSGFHARHFTDFMDPVTMGRQHDPGGAWVRRWVPELAGAPDRYVHAPWEAPADQRGAAGRPPIVEPAAARERALTAYAALPKYGARAS
ncbi:MAG: deoxyribodipyrimidine photo-lyase [Alphaproteobacteria bacterium]